MLIRLLLVILAVIAKPFVCINDCAWALVTPVVKPLSWLPLPKIYAPLIFPVAVMFATLLIVPSSAILALPSFLPVPTAASPNRLFALNCIAPLAHIANLECSLFTLGIEVNSYDKFTAFVAGAPAELS